jgi:hypothetical protein
MLEEEPLVAVIVLNYNGAAYVNRCLNSIFRNSYSNFEVIFIDNNSNDNSVELASRLFNSNPHFTMIRNSENLGFSIGNNIGFKRTKAKYVIVLNNDTEVQENFIETLVKVAESNEIIGSVGCKIVQQDGSIRYGPKYMSYGFIVHATRKQTYDNFTANLANCGCASLYRKSVIDKIDGFDPFFWADWEDHDLGYRLILAGFKSVYTPKTTVLHLGGGLSLGMNEERRVRIFRNKLLTYLKNYQARNLLLRFPLIFLLSSAKEILFMLKNKKISTIFNELIGFFRAIRPIINERKRIQRMRTLSDSQIFSTCRIPEQQSFWDALKLL